jgi:pimeloyl-ACP methyl ester carboxylesterase
MLAFDRFGSGPPLLLLHGTTSSRSIWEPLLPELRREREVLTVDLPAHGQSPATSFTPLDWSKEVAGFLDQLGLQRVAIVGHSSGAGPLSSSPSSGVRAQCLPSLPQACGTNIHRPSPMRCLT